MFFSRQLSEIFEIYNRCNRRLASHSEWQAEPSHIYF